MTTFTKAGFRQYVKDVLDWNGNRVSTPDAVERIEAAGFSINKNIFTWALEEQSPREAWDTCPSGPLMVLYFMYLRNITNIKDHREAYADAVMLLKKPMIYMYEKHFLSRMMTDLPSKLMNQDRLIRQKGEDQCELGDLVMIMMMHEELSRKQAQMAMTILRGAFIPEKGKLVINPVIPGDHEAIREMAANDPVFSRTATLADVVADCGNTLKFLDRSVAAMPVINYVTLGQVFMAEQVVLHPEKLALLMPTFERHIKNPDMPNTSEANDARLEEIELFWLVGEQLAADWIRKNIPYPLAD